VNVQRLDGVAAGLAETNRSRLARLAGGRVTRISVASMEPVDALPLSAAGKVLERELRRPHWAGHEPTIH
jgi:acyl-CoA synthetase (AMP-forming)/AMP-acid ligase II